MDNVVRSFDRQMRDSLNAWTLDASLLERKVEIIELNNRNILSENTTILVLLVEIYVQLVNCLGESLYMLWMDWCQWIEQNILMDKRWRLKVGLVYHPHSQSLMNFGKVKMPLVIASCERSARPDHLYPAACPSSSFLNLLTRKHVRSLAFVDNYTWAHPGRILEVAVFFQWAFISLLVEIPTIKFAIEAKLPFGENG